jgi:type 1 glutamine amidotransferase
VVSGNHRRGRRAAALAALAFALTAQQRPDSSTRRAAGQPLKTILAFADVSTDSYQHDSISHALSTVEELGLQAGLYDTVIRTDPQLLTKGALAFTTGTLTFYKNLDDFDAVLWLASGEPALAPDQKRDILSFVREGKGLVVIHSGIGSSPSWSGFAGMIGGTLSEEPENVRDIDVAVVGPEFSAMKLFAKSFRIRDNISPIRLGGAGDLRVLAESRGIPVAWTKSYGRGRIFASQLGHTDAAWDRRDFRHMIFEAIRWAIGDAP